MMDELKILRSMTVNKTQRVHQCAICNKKVSKGSRVFMSVMVYDGRILNVYTCESHRGL